VKKLAIAAGLALAVGGCIALAQEPVATPGAAPQQPATDTEVPATFGLGDLEKLTFACPRAGLNAAAREAARYPSQGAYKFSYFNIISDSHHAAYEVHFKSNVVAEPVLKYCVMLYCQQGFDPAATKATVMLMGAKGAAHAVGAGHAADACSQPTTPAKPRTAR
jgi:hypothetical protein